MKRLYASPSSTHSGNARTVIDKTVIPTMVDLLDPLDRCVTTQAAGASGH
ncbi:hypothetical protein [Aquabacterium sp.]